MKGFLYILMLTIIIEISLLINGINKIKHKIEKNEQNN